jgi:hypothetical protein
MEKLSVDIILESLKDRIENREDISKDKWLKIAFDLNTFRLDEEHILNGMRQEVAQLKVSKLDEIDNKGKTKSIARIDIEVEASDLYRLMRNQEARVEVIKEYERIAKKSAEEQW